MANSTVNLIAHNANVGNLYSRMGIHDTAFVYLEEAIRLGRASTYKTWLAHALNVYGESLMRKGIKDSALIALQEATKIAHEIKEPFRLKNSYEGLIKLFTTFNDYKKCTGLQRFALFIKRLVI
ncbi:MAG: hypothetical protein IPJ79_15915 [Bacteroidetes bacterium]|nr:hypothetical protein [Bacteroidota bacterium]